jgi:hypothetical protein
LKSEIVAFYLDSLSWLVLLNNNRNLKFFSEMLTVLNL